MPATFSPSHARTFIRQAKAYLQQAEEVLDALDALQTEPEAQPVKPAPWDREDDLALVRLDGDGCPHCD
jgi:alkyl hydroperoxide reductase subunit AhpC